MKGKILLITLLLSTTAFSWWNGSFSYRTPLELTDVTYSDYQTLLILNSSNINYSHTNSSGYDIRIVDGSENLRPLWIERWNESGNSYLWVNISLPDTDAYIYHGNNIVSGVSNCKRVFLECDDFENGWNGTYWDNQTGAGDLLQINDTAYQGINSLLMNPAGYHEMTIYKNFTTNITANITGMLWIMVLVEDSTFHNQMFNIHRKEYVNCLGLNTKTSPYTYRTDDIGTKYTISGVTPANNKWWHIGTTFNSSGSYFYWTDQPIPMRNIQSQTGSLKQSDGIKIGDYNGGTERDTWIVDAFRIKYWIPQEPALSFGSEEAYQTFIITIKSPKETQSYLDSTILLNFTVTDGWSEYNVNISKDGVFNKSVNVSNGVYWSDLFDGFTEGSHNFTLLTNASVSKTVTFNVVMVNFTTNYEQPVYETKTSPINATIKHRYPIFNVTLEYNGANHSTTNVSDFYTYNQNIPLVSTNMTGKNFKWHLITQLPSGNVSRNSSTYTQNVSQAYYYNTLWKNQTDFLIGEYFYPRANMTYYINKADITARIWINNTEWFDSVFMGNESITYIYRGNVTAPRITTFNETFTYRHTFYLEFEGSNRTINSSTDTFVVYYLWLDNCGNASAKILEFKAYDEENESLVLLNNINYYVKIVNWFNERSTNMSFYAYNQNSLSICIYPSWAKFQYNMSALYTKLNYSQREYYIINATTTTPQQNITLFMLLNDSATLIDINVKDEYNNDVSYVYIDVLRWSYNDNAYRTIAKGVTDSLGHALINLKKYDVPYRFILVKNGRVVKEYAPMKINTNSLLFTITSEAIDIYAQWEGIEYLCDYSDQTKVLHCTLVDPTGLMGSGRLEVLELKMFGALTLCNNTATGSSITLICNLENITNATTGFQYKLYAVINGYTYIIDSNTIFTQPAGIFGDTGVLMTLFIVILLGMVGIWNPAVAMVLTFVGLVVSIAVGLLTLDFVPLVALGILMVILIFRMRV